MSEMRARFQQCKGHLNHKTQNEILHLEKGFGCAGKVAIALQLTSRFLGQISLRFFLQGNILEKNVAQTQEQGEILLL
jgi:hypothetical protein